MNAPPFFEFDTEVLWVKDPLDKHRIIRFKLLEPDTIKFVPGQFVQVLIEGTRKPASFSIASSPQDTHEVELAYHCVGEVTGLLSKMTPGMHCKLRGPLGRFTFTAEDGDAVFLAGGVGVTPFMSAVRFVNDLKLPNKCTMFYSGKTKEQLVYLDEMQKLTNQSIDIVPIVTREIPDDWTGETRRVDAAMIQTHVANWAERNYYVCGPGPFIDGMIAMLKGLDIPEKQIRRELW